MGPAEAGPYVPRLSWARFPARDAPAVDTRDGGAREQRRMIEVDDDGNASKSPTLDSAR